ncbi:MAG TPA: phosphonoacetaldehyde hydrolase [Candidatus Hydrogenedentes bacterium]|nr:phosphonoacetaldehyde hydrolase [Candidatus Hydrogenedentota bacterium]HPG69740.1 phosphonoacetaldehyde hydrolase [Candidatus Hydrogenedentota bacterium]
MKHFVYQRSYRGPLKAVILDWAGTTMDYGCYAPAVVFIEVYKRHGVEITVDQARGPMGAHKRDHIQQISQMEEVAKKWEAKYGRQPNDDDVSAMFEDFVPLQIECLAHYADLIPGCLEALDEFRKRDLKIGSTTGYTGAMVEVLLKEAAKRGYVPDSTVCATEVPKGRPAPWMCVQNAMNLGVYPMESVVKIGDTVPDIYEGLNAGMWTIGLAKTGNEMGLTEAELEALDPEVYARRIDRAYTRLAQAGAHYVVDSILDAVPLIDEINDRLACGDRP